jgi:hypothetical protein
MMTRLTALALLGVAGSLALPAAARQNATMSRSSNRTWFEAGTPVELRNVDRSSNTVRIGMGDAEQTFVVEKNAEAGFDALGSGAPVLLSWRFNRAAQAEAVLRVLTERGAVTMVARPVR